MVMVMVMDMDIPKRNNISIVIKVCLMIKEKIKMVYLSD